MGRDQGCNTTSLQLNLEVVCSESTLCPLAAHSGLAWGSALSLFPRLMPLFSKHCKSTRHAWGLPLAFGRFLSRVRLCPPGVESRGTEHTNEVTSKLTTGHIRMQQLLWQNSENQMGVDRVSTGFSLEQGVLFLSHAESEIGAIFMSRTSINFCPLSSPLFSESYSLNTGSSPV